MIKHATSSMFVFHRHHDEWRTGLIHHPLLKAWIQPGGHVDADENPAQAALREAREETGLRDITPLSLTDGLPQQEGITHVPMPCWIAEHEVARDNHLAAPHIHIDFKYVGVTRTGRQGDTPDHPFRWFRQEEVNDAETLDDIPAWMSILFALLDSRMPS